MIMGRTGSGKTTLVRTINRIVPRFTKGSFSGTVHLFGSDIRTRSVASLAGDVGMVFQDFESQLFSTSIQLDLAFGPENMAVPPDRIAKRMDRILTQFQLTGLRDRDPATLSGGQKQRLAIATIMMLDPPVIILDEPTTDLDPESRDMVYRMLGQLRDQGRTVILIDHSPDLIRQADRVVLMDRGRIVRDATPVELVRHPGQLNRCGIRMPQIQECLWKLGLEPALSEPAEAAETIRKSAQTPDPKRYEILVARERSPRTGDPVIEIRDLLFSYDRQPVLNGIDLVIHRGEFVTLAGQNGSGKTTLAKHFNGLLSPGSGTLLLGGIPVQKWKAAELAGTVGYVFQNPDHQIFRPTVREEVLFGPVNLGLDDREADARVAEALETVGLTGYDDRDPFMLTKGESQRLAVASILAMHPQILILDEPTTGLDHPDQIRMMDLLTRLNRRGHTVIMITHSMTLTAQFADRVIVMENGSILTDGPVRDVFGRIDILIKTGLKPPPVTRLGLEFDMVVRSVDEFVDLCRPGGTRNESVHLQS